MAKKTKPHMCLKVLFRATAPLVFQLERARRSIAAWQTRTMTSTNGLEHNCYYMAEADRLWNRLRVAEEALAMPIAVLIDPAPRCNKLRQEITELRMRLSQLVALGLKHEAECKGEKE